MNFVISISSSYAIQDIKILDGNNFKACKMEKSIGIVALILLYLEKVLILLGICFMIFLEWNIQKTIKEIKIITASTSITFLFLILVTIFFNYTVNNYQANFIIRSLLIIFYVSSNYLLFFINKMVSLIFKNDHLKEFEVKPIVIAKTASISNSNCDIRNSRERTNSSNATITALISLHNYTGEPKICRSSNSNMSSRKASALDIRNDKTILTNLSSRKASTVDIRNDKNPIPCLSSRKTSTVDIRNEKSTIPNLSSRKFSSPQ